MTFSHHLPTNDTIKIIISFLSFNFVQKKGEVADDLSFFFAGKIQRRLFSHHVNPIGSTFRILETSIDSFFKMDTKEEKSGVSEQTVPLESYLESPTCVKNEKWNAIRPKKCLNCTHAKW